MLCYASQKTSCTILPCCDFDAREHILIIFGRNVTDKVGNQKHFTTPHQITCACALPGKTGKHENCIFHSNARIQPVAPLLLQFFDSRLILTLLCDSLNLVVSAFSSGLLRGTVQEKEISRGSCSSLTVYHAQSNSALSSGFPLSQGSAEALDR